MTDTRYPTTQAQDLVQTLADQAEMMQVAASEHATRSGAHLSESATAIATQAQRTAADMQAAAMTSPAGLPKAYGDYVRDAAARMVLFADAMRQRADMLVDHNRDYGAKPVLIYDSEKVMDGADLPRPCNYFLLRILPPEGVTVDDTKRPYVIIDPRAGHGAGIGGFKRDSQVGVALNAGHPVYFIAFRQMPEPGQTLARVTEAEAAFLRKIEDLHPKSPNPVVIGNCQGGWAAAILAATNPDITGPIVLSGAPMSYWGGKLGRDPMRYSGGLVGGAAPATMAGDLAGGIFDGAELVQNFEALNPGRKWFAEYFDLYRNPTQAAIDRFLTFEKWWGGFYLMTTEEITWIVENLFIGNKLASNMAQIEPGRNIDLKAIRAPIICFASHGDTITPPAQALNWIMDTYASPREIEIRGQRILYMVHEDIGHLGIFVSGRIANREHSQMAETLANIEALPPGLYEIVIEDVQGHGQEKSFKLSIAKRGFEDILAHTGERREEQAFAAVARMSEQVQETYDASLRPVVKSLGRPEVGEAMRKSHPMRVVREGPNSHLPGMHAVGQAAERVRESHAPLPEGNPFVEAEKLFGEMVETGLNMIRDTRAAMTEMAFLSLYLSPAAMMYGAKRRVERTKKDPQTLDSLPEVQMMLNRVDQGGVPEAIIRMMILLAGTRGDTRADRLARSMETMHTRAPLKDFSVEERVRMIHEQTVIARFAPEAAFEALPKLVRTPKQKSDALAAVRYVVGDESEMADATRDMIHRMEEHLGLEKGSTAAPAQAAE